MSEMPTTSTKDQAIVLDSFDVDVAKPTTAHLARMRLLASLITQKKQQNKILWANIVVTGHTDSNGTDAHNMQLGTKRAEQAIAQIKAFFASNQISKKVYFTAQSAGKSKPFATNSSDSGRAKNRRVEISVEWVAQREQVNPVKKVKPKLPLPKLPEFQMDTSACMDFKKLLRRVGQMTFLKLNETYTSTNLYWTDRGGITLSYNRINDHFLRNFTVDLQNEIIGSVKGKLRDQLMGNAASAKFGVALMYLTFFSTVYKDNKNKEIMRSKEKSAKKKMWLVCLLVAEDDVKRGIAADHIGWAMTLHKNWKELSRLQTLCNNSLSTGDTNSSYNLPNPRAIRARRKRK